jgi:tetratricopeptide (TPR) repeat protein
MNVSRPKLAVVSLVIFVVTVWLFWPCTRGDFLRVDDQEYLRQSMRWNGLTWSAVKWAFTSTDSYYQPLPRLSHVLDYQIWGRNAAGHHATSVFLHALNAALVFGFLWTLLGSTSLSTGERWMVAFGVAVVFGIHPLQAESVAWMSGRTQLLCATFCIGSIWAYTAAGPVWIVGGLFLLAALSKPMAVSLPFVMLAIDYFPLRRHERLGWGRLVREKAVLIGISALVVVVTMVISRVREIAALAPLVSERPSAAVSHLFVSLTYYLVKLVWPLYLSPNYLLDMSIGRGAVLVSALCVLGITVLVVWQGRRMPMLVAGWAAYVMLVLPVSGLLPTGRPTVAERYAYVAILPPLLVAVSAGVWAWRRSTAPARLALASLLAGELCLFVVGTRRLIPDWHDDETLRRATLAAFPDSEQANRELAMELSDQGRPSDALAYAQRSVAIAPQRWESHEILGRVFCHLDRLPEAIAEEEHALQINSRSSDAQFDLGEALMKSGQLAEAAERFQQLIGIKPDSPGAHYDLGLTWYLMGRLPEAVRQLEVAVQLGPDYADMHHGLGMALAKIGKTNEAVAQFEQTLRLKPDFAEAHYGLAIILEQSHRVPEAVAHYRQVLKLQPDFAAASNALARLRAAR